MLNVDTGLYGLMVALALVTVLLTGQRLQKDVEDMRWLSTVYSRTVRDTHGNPVQLKAFQGQVLLIVNIASRWVIHK